MRRGFTLMEVLVSLLLMVIALPAVMHGISAATEAGTVARRQTEAAALGESILNQLVAGGQWQTGNTAGDFGSEAPGYRWQLFVQPWDQDTSGQGIQQLDLSVFWTARGREDSLTLSTLAYVRSSNGGT